MPGRERDKEREEEFGDDGGVNDQLRQLFESIEAASSEGLTEVALDGCEKALMLLEENFEEVEDYTPADFLMLAGHAHWGSGNLEDSLRSYNDALHIEPGRADAQVAVGVTLFHLARFEAARHQLEVVTAEESDIGEAWYYLALLARRRGDRKLSDRFFQKAADLEPEMWPIPVDMPQKDVHALLEQFYADMPKPLRDALANVPIIVEERPSEDLLFSADPPLDPLLLGLFDGTPLPEGSDFATSPTAIFIFTENVALVAPDRAKLEEELWITLKHEIGHFFGLDEDELAARGLA